MNGQKSKENFSASSSGVDAIATMSPAATCPEQRVTQNFMLLWLDSNIDESSEDCQNTLTQFRSVVNDINIFTKRDAAIDFLTEVFGVQTFLIVEGSISEHIVSLIHDIPQLVAIYIFCRDQSRQEHLAKEWIKIRGVYTDIKFICEALQLTEKQYNQDSISMSFVAVGEAVTNANLNELEPTFMYTQIFKEILFEIEQNEQSIKDFIQFWRLHYIDNIVKLKDIAEFERDYCPQYAITWYTRECFLYEMLNRALRMFEAGNLIHMGFFIRDLHQQIEKGHQKQINSYHRNPFVVYRGQGLSKMDFQKLLNTRGGLISFNNFLSTSSDRDVSLLFAEGALGKTDVLGVLFKMTIDPSISSAPFASIRETSYFQTEEEILFSMHTVFRIGEITKIDNSSSLYQVDLKLTADDDQQLRALTKRIQQEFVGQTGWQRLGLLLVKTGHLVNAEILYNGLLEQTSHELEKAAYYNNLGCVKNDQGDYKMAIAYYEKAHEIQRKTLPPNHPLLAVFHSNIGRLYTDMGEYSKALSFYNSAFEIRQSSLPTNHPHHSQSYNNIASVYQKTGQYSNALSFYKKAFEIDEKTLPSNDPSLATSCSNIGGVYDDIGDYSEALFFHEKALQIQRKSLPSNHPDLATSYNNIGGVYDHMGQYSKALLSYEKVSEIRQKALPPNHPDSATSYNNIGLVYKNMGNYSKALPFYEKALNIRQNVLPPNHPDFAQSYNNIGSVYFDIGKNSKALSFYEKALDVCEKSLPSNHPLLATSLNNIGSVYQKIEEYSKALLFYKKAFEIKQKTLPLNHPSLANSCSNIGSIYDHMADYSDALSFYDIALNIRQKALPPNHPDFAQSYNNIATVYLNMKDLSKALSFYEKALEIREKALPPDHPDVATSYNNIGGVYLFMGQKSKALSYLEHALNIFQRSLPVGHPNLQIVQEGIEIVKKL